MDKSCADVAVIGGGIIGMLTAYSLSKAGVRVCLVEKSEIAQESSWAGGGILTPLYPWRYPQAVNNLAFRSFQLYPQLMEDLKELSGIDPEYRNTGLLLDEQDLNVQAHEWLKQHQQKFQCVSSEKFGLMSETQRREFLFFPDICQVRNPRLAKALFQTLLNLGVQIHSNFPVEKINFENDLGIVCSTQGDIQAKKIVVCTGAWTGKLLADCGVSIPIKPVRGQMLLYKADPDLLSSIVLSNGKYMIPRKDGRILVGSTMEDVGFDKSTTQTARVELQTFAESILPELKNAEIEKHWSGLRPASPDGTPFICQHPVQKSLYINSGHFRNGVVLAPASAELIKDVLLGNPTHIDPLPYNVQC